ncbi:MAG: hypothetical protein LBP53_03350 [Candidatus Peribacteria bacterium]|jgi:hypothetical protein|nr:hypothetical protein [Candidatus Peribacteria bacterium]
MLNKLFSRPGKPTEKETVGENSSKKQKSISANDIYIALKKYTSIGGKHFKIGLFPTLPER